MPKTKSLETAKKVETEKLKREGIIIIIQFLDIIVDGKQVLGFWEGRGRSDDSGFQMPYFKVRAKKYRPQ